MRSIVVCLAAFASGFGRKIAGAEERISATLSIRYAKVHASSA